MSAAYVWPQSMLYPPKATPWMKTGSPCPSSHQLSIALQAVVGVHEPPFVLECWLARNYSFCELISTIVISCPEHIVLLWSSLTSDSYYLSWFLEQGDAHDTDALFIAATLKTWKGKKKLKQQRNLVETWAGLHHYSILNINHLTGVGMCNWRLRIK